MEHTEFKAIVRTYQSGLNNRFINVIRIWKILIEQIYFIIIK